VAAESKQRNIGPTKMPVCVKQFTSRLPFHPLTQIGLPASAVDQVLYVGNVTARDSDGLAHAAFADIDGRAWCAKGTSKNRLAKILAHTAQQTDHLEKSQ